LCIADVALNVTETQSIPPADFGYEKSLARNFVANLETNFALLHELEEQLPDE